MCQGGRRKVQGEERGGEGGGGGGGDLVESARKRRVCLLGELAQKSERPHFRLGRHTQKLTIQ